jgi:ribosome-binding factor A
MSASQARQRKLAERIQHIVADMLERLVKDPRLGFVTVTDVRVTPDLREALIFYTVLGSPEEQMNTRSALDSATGLLRYEVGRQIGIKFTPTLTFIADAVPENARHIEDLLAQAAAADAQVHQKASHARYAGEADPYRHPGE